MCVWGGGGSGEGRGRKEKEQIEFSRQSFKEIPVNYDSAISMSP